MGRIQLLDDGVINKICAGEVVERPASVVKELVENALDAGASQITVALELGGTRSIVVTDDGHGLSPDEAPKALLRHATSKLRGADDLFSIGTMGFRGEALASIASVSRFGFATRERGLDDGIKITVSGEEPPAILPWTAPVGTTVSVENLFFNMPVRAKFLKAPATEFSHALELIQAFALCHPEVGFTLQHNGREQFRVTPVTASDGAEEGARTGFYGEAALRERAVAVLPRDVAEQLIYLNTASRYGNVEALVSPPGVEKATGKLIFTFVNGRWVKDKTVRYGIMRGYHSHLLKGRFPIAVVHVTLDPSLVDVNVHPAKTELRFQYGSELQNAIALAIRERLRQPDWASSPLPDFGSDRPLTGASAGLMTAAEPAWEVEPEVGAGPAVYKSPKVAAFAPRGRGGSVSVSRRSYEGGASIGLEAGSGAVTSREGLLSELGLSAGASPDDLETTRPAGLPARPFAAQHPDEPHQIPWDELEFIGSFDRCYLFFSAGDRMLVMDQHAFHERVLYERLRRDESLLGRSQPLLVPEAVELSPTEIETLRARRHLLQQRGFAFDVEGDTTVAVRAVPSILAGRAVDGLFADLATPEGEIGSEPADSNAELARLVLATAACHAAVRAGEELGENELKQLLGEARTVDFYHNCPHGRRVFKWWSKGQVAHWFDR